MLLSLVSTFLAFAGMMAVGQVGPVSVRYRRGIQMFSPSTITESPPFGTITTNELVSEFLVMPG